MQPSEETLDYNIKRGALLLVWMLVAAGAVWALRSAWPLVRWFFSTLSPFIVALVLAYILNPIVDTAQHRFRLGRVGGILAVAALIVLVVLLLFGMLLPILYEQGAAFVTAVQKRTPELLRAGDNWLGRFLPEDTRARTANWFREFDFRAAFEKYSPVFSRVAKQSASTVGAAAAGLAVIISQGIGFFVAAGLVVVIVFYYLVDFHAIPSLIRKALPAGSEDRTLEVLGRVDQAVGGFLRGQLIVCCLVAAIASAGLAALGMYKYAVLVGVLAGAGNIVPYLGPVLGAAPGVLWGFLAEQHESAPEKFLYAGLVILLFIGIQVLDGFVFQPRIVGKNSDLHPLLVMAALLIGAQAGLGGMIIAVPTACVAKVLFIELVWRPHCIRKKKGAETRVA